MNRLRDLIRGVGTIARRAAPERLSGASGELGVSDSDDARDDSRLPNPSSLKFRLEREPMLKGERTVTQHGFATPLQTSLPVQKRAGYSVREVAKQYGLSEPFVRLEIKRGNLRAAKLGRRVVIPIDSVKDWVSGGMSL